METQIKERKARFQELDALRGIAALMVVIFHFTYGWVYYDSVFSLGCTGVDLFFIISGFVIFLSLTRVKSSLEFAINRVSRLYPTYWTIVSFTFLLVVLKSIFNDEMLEFSKIGQYFANMTMFQQYMGIRDLDGSYWTMIVEMAFYIAIALLFHFKMLRWLNYIGVVTIFLVLIGTTYFSTNRLVTAIYFVTPFLQFLPLFLAGTVFYKLYRDGNHDYRRYVLIMFCFISQIHMFDSAGRAMFFITQEKYALMLCIYFILFLLFVNKRLERIVCAPSLFLGKISYALYLIHQYVGTKVMIPYLTETLGVGFAVSAVLITLPTVIVLATVVTYLIEQPMNKFMRNTLRQRFLQDSLSKVTN